MKAVVFNDINNLTFEERENPKIENESDVILEDYRKEEIKYESCCI